MELRRIDRRHRIALVGVSLALVVAQGAFAQTQGGSRYNPATNPMEAGRGRSLGSGGALDGQTFSWIRGRSQGQSLGQGNALDANTQVGSGGYNAPARQTDYGARNLLVTGNVAGGRGFRGSVGYTAATDFRGATGSDATYSFEADAAYSSPTFFGTNYAADRFRMAQGMGDFQYRRETTPTGVPSAGAPRATIDADMRLDRAGAQLSPSAGRWEYGEDRLVETSRAQNGDPIRYIASPLRGLQAENLTDPVVRSGLDLYEQARARQDIAEGLMKPEDFDAMRPSASLDLSMTQRMTLNLPPPRLGEDLRVEGQRVAPKTYDEIIEGIARAYADDPTKNVSVDPEIMQRIREELAELRAPMGEPKAPTETPTEKPTDGTTEQPTEKPAEKPSERGDGRPVEVPALPGGAPVPQGAEDLREEDREKVRGKARSVTQYAEILRHGRTISELSKDDQRRVGEIVRGAEEALRRGEYFSAESRFRQAQDMASGNPLTEVGIAHSQIGAGLYLSSALTIRNMFLRHPELIDAYYDPALLPTGERLDRAMKYMREKITRGDDRPGYGLVLAYIGHQLKDKAVVEEGLSAIQGSPTLDAESQLLRGVWLGGK
ncbi:MAG: PT domain-containing protein [Phycisphaerales bacterium]